MKQNLANEERKSFKEWSILVLSGELRRYVWRMIKSGANDPN